MKRNLEYVHKELSNVLWSQPDKCQFTQVIMWLTNTRAAVEVFWVPLKILTLKNVVE